MKQPGRVLAIALLTLMVVASPMVAPPMHASPAPGASQQLVVLTGVADGTYAQFFREISRACPQPRLRGIASQGSVENLERLLSNDAHLAFVQADVLFAKKLVEHNREVDTVRTFLVLYLEEVHILVEASNDSISKFSDLVGKEVGVYGGSIITERILVATTGVQPASIPTFPGPREAVQALRRDVDAVLGVGGKPLPWVEGLVLQSHV